jgi:hypothetical protein
MLKHHCAALLIFHDAETPLRNTGDFLPDAETPLFNTFHSFPFQKNIPAVILTPKTIPSSTCFVFFPPSIAETPLAATFLVAETPATFHFLPVAETPSPATFHQFSRC